MEYDKIGHDFANYKDSALTEWELGYPEVIDALGTVEGSKILDFGCGSGDFTTELNSLGAVIHGVDISREMIDIAQQQHPDLQFTKIDSIDHFRELFSGQNFDAVVSNFVFCTLPTKATITQTFNAINGCLSAEGSFIFMNANWEASNGKKFASFELPFVENPRSGDSIKPLLGKEKLEVQDYYWTESDYIECLATSGFVVEGVHEPKAETDRDEWVSETESSPFKIFHARKTEFRTSRRSTTEELLKKQPYDVNIEGLHLHVAKDVFPPDFGSTTSVIVDYLKKTKCNKALDMGTGTGYLALLLASGIASEVWATDIHEPAVECARQNAHANNKTIHVVQGDLFSGVAGEKFDLIVFNQPLYPSDHEIFGIDSSGGREIITRFLKEAKNYLNKEGMIVMAHHPDSGAINDPAVIAKVLGYKIDHEVKGVSREARVVVIRLDTERHLS
jgi:release factor glutamine methyltransferase